MLGCGTSAGVPRICNDWGSCDPKEPRNRRSRSSIMIEGDDGFRVLVDTTPDLRSQCLAHDVGHIDAVIWTHDHADHCHGIDDLRGFYLGSKRALDGYGSARTMQGLQDRFGYVFKGNRGYPATCVPSVFESNPWQLGGMTIRTTEMPHGPICSTGIRFQQDAKSIGYATDFHAITDDMVALFADIDVLVVDALRIEPHPTHATLDMAIELASRSRAKRAVLTHMDKSMDYGSLCVMLPPHIVPGHDGLEIIL